eukprot:7294236-Alexandrium_andersonii.AAC.1
MGMAALVHASMNSGVTPAGLHATDLPACSWSLASSTDRWRMSMASASWWTGAPTTRSSM